MSAGVSLLTIPITIHSKYLPINQFLLMDQSSNTQLKTLSTLLLTRARIYKRHREYLVSVNISLISVTWGKDIIRVTEHQLKNVIRKHIPSQGETLMFFLIICFVLFGSTANLQKMILFLTDVLLKTERERGRERERSKDVMKIYFCPLRQKMSPSSKFLIFEVISS